MLMTVALVLIDLGVNKPGNRGILRYPKLSLYRPETGDTSVNDGLVRV
jgi:hypothetical protein